jgi:NAD(P)H-hydrate epimerase
MSRLSGQETADIQADRTGIARQAAADWDQIILLKGAFTVIAEPGGRTTVIPFANPALSTAGTGDVLAGIIVSLLGQGMVPYEAAVAGAFIHGAAGEMTSQMIGRAGTMAGDLLPAVGAILEDWGL